MLVKRNVVLKEPEHIYSDELGNRYISVTTTIGLVTPKFREEYWLLYGALKRSGYKVRPDTVAWESIYIDNIKVTIKDLLSQSFNIPLSVSTSHIKGEWEHLKEIACVKGTEIHKQIEDGTNATVKLIQGDKAEIEGEDIRAYRRIKKQFPEVFERVKEDIDAGYTIHTEKIVYLNWPFLAGMIDNLIVSKYGTFRIKDWKTNKSPFRFEAGYYKKQTMPDGSSIITTEWVSTREKMLYPLCHLDNSIGNKYALQLSIYAYICEMWGMKLEVDGLQLCHIRGNKTDTGIIIADDITWHKMPYLKNEAKAVINFLGLKKEEKQRLQNEIVI